VDSSRAATDISSPAGGRAGTGTFAAAAGSTEGADSNPNCPAVSEAGDTWTDLTGNTQVANSKVRDSLKDSTTGDTLVVTDDKMTDTLEDSRT